MQEHFRFMEASNCDTKDLLPCLGARHHLRSCIHASMSGSSPVHSRAYLDWTCLGMPHISSSLSVFSTVWQGTSSSQGHCHRGVTLPWGMYLVSDNLSEGSAGQVASRTHNFQAEHFIAAKWSKGFSSLVSGLTVAADWLYSCCLKGRGLCPPAIV